MISVVPPAIVMQAAPASQSTTVNAGQTWTYSITGLSAPTLKVGFATFQIDMGSGATAKVNGQILSVATNNLGTTASVQFKIPMLASGTYSVNQITQAQTSFPVKTAAFTVR